MIIRSRKPEAGSRTYYFDYLRVLACFSVIIMHITAIMSLSAEGTWYNADVKSFYWHVLNVYNCLVRFCVPVFVMISGALFLNPDKYIPVRKLYTKYIPRIVILFIFWSVMLSVTSYIKGIIIDHTNDLEKLNLEDIIIGPFHFWFLYMIVGLYMIVPLLRKITESESLTKYFLVLAVIFTFFLPDCADFISLFSEKYGKFLSGRINTLDLRFAAGFTGYFLLGHFLNKVHISRKTERIIYLVGIAAIIMMPIVSGYISVLKNKPVMIFDYISVNVLCESTVLFVFFKQHFNRENKFIRKLSQYSLGAYIVHVKAMNLTNMFISMFKLKANAFSILFAVPAVGAVIFVIALTASGILNHIPVIKKYLV